VILERHGHVVGQFVRAGVDIWYPADHLVELQEDARRLAVVAPALGLLAFSLEPVVLEAAHLIRLGRLVLVTVGDVLTRQVFTDPFVRLNKVVERFDPMFDVVVVTVLVPDQCRLNVLLSGQRPETHCRVPKQRSTAAWCVLGEMVGVEGLVEDGHHHSEETGQEDVEDDVEHTDLEPRFAGPAQKFRGVTIPYKFPKPLILHSI